VRIAFRRIQKQIRDARPLDMHALGRHVREQDAVCNGCAGPRVRSGEKLLFAVGGKAEEPEDGGGERGQDAQPGAEGGGVDFVELVEVGEDDCRRGKAGEYVFADLPATGKLLGPGDVAFVGRGALAVVAAEEGVARVDYIFAINPVVVFAAAGLVEAEIGKVDVRR